MQVRRSPIWSLILALAPCLAWADLAAAQTRIVVADFDGPAAAQIRAGAVRSLGRAQGVEVLPSWRFRAATEQAGGGGQGQIQAARKLSLDSVVSGGVRRRGGTWTAEIRVKAPDGSVRTTSRFRAGSRARLKQKVQAGLAREVAQALHGTPSHRATAEPEPEPESKPEPSATHLTEERRVVILNFAGPGASRARASVVSALSGKAHISLVPQSEVTDAAEWMEADLNTKSGRAKVARELRLSSLVEGRVSHTRRGWTTSVRVYDGRRGALTGKMRLSARRPAQMAEKLSQNAYGELEGAIADTRFAETAEGDLAASHDEVAAPSGEDGVEAAEANSDPQHLFRHGRSPLDVEVGIHAFSRTLEYNEDLFGELRGYRLGFGSEVATRLTWYPAAHFTDSSAAHIGLEGSFGYGLRLQSENADGSSFPTEALRYSLGAVGRIPLGRHDLRADVAYGRHMFRIDPSGPMTPDNLQNQPGVPDVDYRFMRFGLGTRIALPGGFAIRARGGYLHMLSLGNISEDAWFPHASARGIEGELSLGYRLGRGFEVRVGAELRRIFYDMKPEPGERNVAGGAVDQYVTGMANLAWRAE